MIFLFILLQLDKFNFKKKYIITNFSNNKKKFIHKYKKLEQKEQTKLHNLALNFDSFTQL